MQPEAFEALVETMARLEAHYRDMQDIEFTIERGTLYLLQTRNGKRTAQAALRIVREFVAEGVITPDEAVLRIRIEADGIGDEQAAEIMARASDRIAAASGSATVETTTAGMAAARTMITAEFPCAS